MKRIMSIAALVIAVLGVTAGVGAPAAAQVCGPLDNGRVADVFYEGTVVFWNPVVQYEYDRMTLTISGPCETIVRTFKPGEQIFFDLGEIQRVVDGRYQWQLRATPTIDPAVQEALQQSRGSGEEDATWWNFWQKGSIPAGPSVDGAAFTVERGVIVDPGSGQESQKRASLAGKSGAVQLAAGAGAAAFDNDGVQSSEDGGNRLSAKDFVILDDLIVDGSACIGFDCVNGESFGFDTIRLKENNLRIKFDDTSTAASFPRNDWQITINDSANGGASKFSIDDISGSRTPFTIEANARSNSLYIDDGGRLGLRTSTPSTEIHTVDGDTPTLRLQQDGSSGFAPQTWDVAGNETNFFVRDVTNGSTLPLRIRPGAPSSAIDIAASGNVGIGTASPGDELHVDVAGANGGVTIESDTNLPQLTINNAAVASDDGKWRFRVNSVGNFVFTHADTNSTSPFVAEPEANTNLLVLSGGEVQITGTVRVNGTQVHPDFVFEPDYALESIEDHSNYMWAEKHLPAIGAGTYQEDGHSTVDLVGHQFGIVEELEKAHIYIDQLNAKLKDKDLRLASMEETNSTLVERQAELESELEDLKTLVQALAEER